MQNNYKSWLEISKKSLIENVKAFKKLVGGDVLVCAVVKANAYGHGLKETSLILKNSLIDWFGADSLTEALNLKSHGIKKPILVLGHVKLSELSKLIENGISFVVYNIDTLKKIVFLKSMNKARIHLKIETGLNRQGIEEKDINKFIDYIKLHRNRFITEGVSMHFADIEDNKNLSFAKLQLNIFNKIVKKIESFGVNFNIKHSAASAAVVLYPQTCLNMVRVGLGLYGLHPTCETINKIRIQPTLTWKSFIVQIKNVQMDQSVGYGRSWTAKRKSKIAVIPVGYSDGYDRKLSNKGRVIINAKFAPVVGRICMNMFMVDVTNISNVKLEDEVIIIGKKGKLEITADEIAEKLGTINYEVVSRINPLLPRIIVK